MNYDWKKIFKETAPLLALMAFIGIISGQVLQSIEKEVLLQFPVFLFLIPVMNALGGNIGAILASRLSSGLHLGDIKPNFYDSSLWENISVAGFMGIITYGAIAFTVTAASQAVPLKILAWNLFIIIGGAAVIITIGALILTTIMTIISYKMNLDPDNIVIPAITTLIDLLSILSLFFMVWLVIL